MLSDEILDAVDTRRWRCGFLTVREVLALADTTVLDPLSVLISRDVTLGRGNVFYPNVLIESIDSTCTIGDENLFHSNTTVLAHDGGTIEIGDSCMFGPGGVQLKVDKPDTVLRVDDTARLMNGAEVMGNSTVGVGAQILGRITAIHVLLESGTSFKDPDPDARAAMLKGTGRAVGLHIRQGEVVNGLGDFAQAPVERQLAYHPRAS